MELARTWSGVRIGVDGRMASWASCAFFTLLVYWRGAGRQEAVAVGAGHRGPHRGQGLADSVVESVRM